MKTEQERRETAQTILGQLGQNRFIAMTGANRMVILGERGGLSFHFRGSRSGNIMKIELNGRDLYNCTLYRFKPRALTCDPVDSAQDVEASKLQEIFTSMTGLRCTLGQGA